MPGDIDEARAAAIRLAAAMGQTDPEEDSMTQAPDLNDLQTLIQSQIAEQLGQMVQQAPQSFEEALADVDPADSEAALAMLDFLLKTGRLGRVGVLDNGQGYLFMYQEPKGSTKQGYKPGATQGDRLVDEAVEAQRAAGKKPTRQGMCVHCFNIVNEIDGRLFADLPDEVTKGDGDVCNNAPDGRHEMA